MNAAASRSVIERFGRLKALVIGDLMLDHFIWGSVSRISPEAPVPVVEVSRETEVPGGAGNVAVNMASLGAEVHLVGLLGNDFAADRLLSLLQRMPIRAEHAIRIGERPTIVKTRVIAHHQQVVRFDREVRGELPKTLQRQILEKVEEMLPSVQVVVVSDYGKGVIHSGLLKTVIPAARKRGIPVTVDPKIENFSHYRQVTCITPNMQEALQGAGILRAGTEEEVERVGQKILKDLGSDSVLVTRGEKGMSLFERKKAPLHIPTRAREVFDVTGAGDTVISTLSLALAAGASLRAAAELANYAAGIVVGKLGTAAVTGQELMETVRRNHG